MCTMGQVIARRMVASISRMEKVLHLITPPSYILSTHYPISVFLFHGTLQVFPLLPSEVIRRLLGCVIFHVKRSLFRSSSHIVKHSPFVPRSTAAIRTTSDPNKIARQSFLNGLIYQLIRYTNIRSIRIVRFQLKLMISNSPPMTTSKLITTASSVIFPHSFSDQWLGPPLYRPNFPTVIDS